MAALPDVVAIAALLALLVTAYRHPPSWVEALVGVVTSGAVLTTGLVGLDDVRTVLEHLGPVVLFLATILVVADLCSRAGLFTAVAGRVARGSRGRPTRLLTGMFVVAAIVTAVLSLDATAVLLTPVVVGAAAALGTSWRPGGYACLRMANSASLLFPVSNLTNLLAMPALGLSFLGFAARMGPVLVVVLVAEYVALRLFFRRDLATAAPAASYDDVVPVPVVPLVVVGLMLAGFVATSPLGIDPFWVSGAAALVLAAWSVARRQATATEVVVSAHLGFAVFVLALGVVVAAVSAGFLGDVVAHLVPGSTSFLALLGVAVLATVLANLLTNLSATLLLLPALAPLGVPGILAALLGLNIGSGLTYTGSLANLLWRRGLVHHGEDASLAEFHRLSLLVTPVVLVLAVATLAIVV